MVLVQNYLLTNNHTETWVWKSTEMKFLTFKVKCNFFSLVLLFAILRFFIWFSREAGYLPSTDISSRPPFHRFLPSFLCCLVFSKWNIHFFILGCTHKNFLFRSPYRLTAQSEKSLDLAVGWSAFALLSLPFWILTSTCQKIVLMDHKITFQNWEMKWGKSLYDKHFFKRELNFKNSQFLMYTVWSANHFIGTTNKFYEIRKITLQYTKNL